MLTASVSMNCTGGSRSCALNIGYPCNQAYDITELFRFLHFSANNVGDPFSGTNYRLDLD
jgi:hypothetical protein